MGNANDCSRQDGCYRPTLYQTCDTGYTEAETRNMRQQTGNGYLYLERTKAHSKQYQIGSESNRRSHMNSDGAVTLEPFTVRSLFARILAAQLPLTHSPPTDRRCAVSLNGGESSPSATKTMQLAVVAKFRLVTAFRVDVRGTCRLYETPARKVNTINL